MSKWDRVDVRTLGGCCVGEVQQLAALGAEGERLGCPACGAVLLFSGGVWALAADTFIGRFGVVRWDRHMGRRYPRDGVCEICWRTTAEVAADFAGRYPPGDDRNAHLRALMFDHCHAHGWVRGLLCLGCNNDMVLYDKSVGRPRFASRCAAHARRCPDCARPSAALLPCCYAVTR